MATMDEETPLVVENFKNENPIVINHERDVYIMSCAFLLIFLAYGAAQNLESTINTEGNLGTISLGILYLSFMFCSIFASLVVRKLGSKNALILGSTGYWLFVAANLMPNWYTMVPASLYLGFAASIIWVGQGTYLTSTARSHANDHSLNEAIIIGKFNGVFYGMFASHQFVGNLFTLALMRDKEGGSTSGKTVLFLVFVCTITLGAILMCFLSKRTGKEEARQQDSSASSVSSVATLLKSIITLLQDIRMLLIIPLIAYSGLQQAFVWAEFTKYLVKPTMGESGVGGAMAVYGVFDAICSLVTGHFTFGLSSISIIVSGGALVQGAVLVWILLTQSVTGGVLGTLYPLFIAALWGIGDGVLNTQLSALLGILFKDDLEGAFAQLKLWQSFAIAIVYFLGPYISLQAMLVIMLVALCLSAFGFLFLTLKVEKAFSYRAV
ncbi:UNC93-like protein 3 [Capsicum annuum]|uniref:UNC93-like protein 3 n=1 Tax=Capsicum annuum TaxID=4072 RepID=A0A2G2YQV1_CAPAN|nr:UNC93-like protein 3 [Capsicum annuum]KAF3667137.1 UNC93-like protein 3 [Capsicum annuum]PHT72137.1 UNC93-like protein 3 [Capsicum annuum]